MIKKRFIILGVVYALALVAAAPAQAQDQTHYTFVSFWAVPRAQWTDFEKAQELMVERAKSKSNIEGNREKYLNRYAFTGTIECGNCGKSYKRHIDNCGNVAESACWICSSYIYRRKKFM